MRYVLAAVLFVAVAAGAQTYIHMARTWSQDAIGGTGTKPFSSSQGVSLEGGAKGIRVTVVTATGTISGGRVCAYFLARDGGLADGGGDWRRNGNLDWTLSSNTSPDGGYESAQVLPDLEIANAFGRAAFVGCGITGTAFDAGTNTYTVQTQSWGPTFP